MTDTPQPDLTEPSEEDAKLIALARSARARARASTAGAVRDDTGRSYVGADVALPSLQISGIELAVAQAVAAGAGALEAAVIVTDVPTEDPNATVVSDVGPAGIPLLVADARGSVVRMLTA